MCSRAVAMRRRPSPPPRPLPRLPRTTLRIGHEECRPKSGTEFRCLWSVSRTSSSTMRASRAASAERAPLRTTRRQPENPGLVTMRTSRAASPERAPLRTTLPVLQCAVSFGEGRVSPENQAMGRGRRRERWERCAKPTSRLPSARPCGARRLRRSGRRPSPLRRPCRSHARCRS